MSVINKMLKDLEQNSPSQNNTNLMLKKESNNQLLVRIIIFLLLSVVLVLWAKIYLPDNSFKTANAAVKDKQQPTVSEKNLITKADTVIRKKIKPSFQAILPLKKEAEVSQQKPAEKTQPPLMVSTTKSLGNKSSIKQKSPVVEKSQQVAVVSLKNDRIAETATPKVQIELENVVLNKPPEQHRSDFSIRKQKTDPKKQAKQLWKKAEVEPRQAEKYLQRAILLDPELHGARLQLIALRVSKRDLYAAEITVNQGLSLFDNDARYIEWKARLLLAADKKQQAKQWLLKSTPQLKTHINYYGLLAGINSQLGEYQSSRDIYQKLVNAQPGHGPWLLGLALTQQKLGNEDAAKITYVQATAGDGLSTRAREFIQQQINKLEH